MIRLQDFGITTKLFRGAYFYLFWHLEKSISLLIFFFLLSFFSPISLQFFVCCSACCLVLNRLATIMKIYQKFQIYLEVELVKKWVVKNQTGQKLEFLVWLVFTVYKIFKSGFKSKFKRVFKSKFIAKKSSNRKGKIKIQIEKGNKSPNRIGK